MRAYSTELFDDCFELTDMLTFYQKKISQPMWQLFELMYKSFKSSGIDYLSGAFGPCLSED